MKKTLVSLTLILSLLFLITACNDSVVITKTGVVTNAEWVVSAWVAPKVIVTFKSGETFIVTISADYPVTFCVGKRNTIRIRTWYGVPNVAYQVECSEDEA